MESWYLLEHGRCSPAWNMACDEWLLTCVSRLGRPVLRTYAWDQPSVTIGYFQPFPVEAPPYMAVIRRPTGGARVIHGSDLTFTVVLPPCHSWLKAGVCERYHYIHERVCKVFELRGLRSNLAVPDKMIPSGRAHATDLCFARNCRYDVLVDGVKVAGGAQRVTREGLLHQGSIQGGEKWRVAPCELSRAWEMCGAHFMSLRPASDEMAFISTLATCKYATPIWNRRVMEDHQF